MSENSFRSLRSGKIVSNSSAETNSFRTHRDVVDEHNNHLATDFDSNSSENQHQGLNTPSQVETNRQIVKLQDQMNEIKTLLTDLTQ